MMTTRKVWITADPYGGLTDGEAAAASAAGAGEILHGIPPVLADVIPAGTVGLVEMAEPDLPIPDLPAPDNAEMMAQLAALGAALLADPDRFAQMVAQMAGSNAAKGPLVYLADALKAAEAP